MTTRAAVKAAEARKGAKPSGATKVVPQGQSSRMAKGREAQEKAAANKAKVDALNAGSAVATNRAVRYEKAKEEQAAVKAWEKAGKKGKRPATPNYDAVARKEPIAGAKAKGEKRPGRKLEGDALDKAKKAYELRVNKKQSFTDIAAALGYPKSSLARRACVSYARQHGLADPVTRRSAKAAERFVTGAGGKFDPKAFKPAAPVAKEAAKKSPPKPTKPVAKKTPGQKAREAATTPSARAKAGVKPIPKSAPAKKAQGRRAA